MPVPMITIVLIISFGVSMFLMMIGNFENNTKAEWLGRIFLIIPISLGSWLYYSSSLPYEVEKTIVTKIYKVNDSQIISFKDKNNKDRIINLNQITGKIYPDDSNIKVTSYKDVYAGIDFSDTCSNNESYELYDGKLEQ